MNTTTASTLSLPSALPGTARRVLSLLAGMSHGQLDLKLPDGQQLSLGQGPLHASLHLHDWRVFSLALKSGDIGFAEAYIQGLWDSPDLAALLKLLLAEREALERVVYGAWWGRLVYLLRHALNRNTRSGSARNIHAHYDLGNAFYAEWLDPSMSYSSAWFEGRPDADLQQAQQAKIRRALDEAGVQAGSRVLELGCGWGSLAMAAAQGRGAQVTGITLSHEQLAWGRQRVAQAGLETQIDLRLQDYRELSESQPAGQYDAIVSIEMFEAVGREYWDSYFRTLRHCLKPGGRACIQTITIRDALFERYVRSTDFIQQYIFPGGLLPSISAFEELAQRHGLVLERQLAFGRDYAETLRRWHVRFNEREAVLREQGFDRRFMRTWRFYLAYCEAGFAQGDTDVVQFTLRRPQEAA